MRRELVRQTIHLVYGVLLSIALTYDVWIGVALSLLFVAGSLAHRKRELPLAGLILRLLDREDPIPAYGAITLTVGITSVFLVLPAQGLAAGIGVAIIDSLATLIGLIGDGRRKKLAASATGGVVFFIVATSVFSGIPTLSLAMAALAGTFAEFFTTQRVLIDDNITVVWAVAIVLALI